MLDREMGVAQADDYVVELENICEDECHLVEDPDAAPIYDSDEDSDCLEYDLEEDSADSNDDVMLRTKMMIMNGSRTLKLRGH